MAIEIMVLLEAVSTLSGIMLIIAGIVAMVWLIARVADVLISLEHEKTEKILIWIGAIVGVCALFNAAANIVVNNGSVNTDLATITLLIVVGVLLILRPLKDVPWAAGIGLIAGLATFGIIIWLFGTDDISKWYVIIAVGVTLGIYMALKFVEDLYQLCAKILALPPVAIAIGLISIIQGILVLLDLSFQSILGF